MHTRSALVLLLATSALFTVARADCADDLTVKGGGSNAVGKVVTDAVNNATQDSNYKGVSIPFYTVGSGDGQKGFVNNTFDFTIADYPLNTKLWTQATQSRQIVQFPIGVGGVNIIYNIPPVNASKWVLNLTADVAAQIFTGKIATWDDPQILAINQNLTLLQPPIPAGQPIKVVARTDSSAANLVFSQWVTSAAPGNWTIKPNATLTWPSTFKTVTKSSGVVYGVGNATWSIAFLDAYAARKAYIPGAALENKAKRTQFPKLKWVKFNATANPLNNTGADVVTPPDGLADWANFTLVDLDGNGTYPMLTTAMVASARDLTGKGNRGAVQKQMFGYLLGPLVQSYLPFYQEAKLPSQLMGASVEGVNYITASSGLQYYPITELPTTSSGYPSDFTY